MLQISIYLNLGDISEISFGRRSTVHPGKADLQGLVEKEMILRENLMVVKPEQTAKGPFDRAAISVPPSTSQTLREMESKARRAPPSSSTRQSALSRYSIDEFGLRVETSQEWDEEDEENEERYRVLQMWPDNMLILGEYTTWIYVAGADQKNQNSSVGIPRNS
jgi:hypothetical protein